MKSFIVLFSLVATTVFAAQDFDAVTEVSHQVAQVSSVDDVIASVTLNNSGVLVIRNHDKSIKTLKLVPANNESMLRSAALLSAAELARESFAAVCMMLVDPRSVQNLLVLETNSGEMQMVLSFRSCAIGEVVYPKQQYAMEVAVTLKSQMIALAQQVAAQSK